MKNNLLKWKIELQEKKQKAVDKIEEIKQDEEYIKVSNELSKLLDSIDNNDFTEYDRRSEQIERQFPLEEQSKILKDLWTDRVYWLSASLNIPEITQNKETIERFQWYAMCMVENDNRYNQSDFTVDKIKQIIIELQ